MSLRDVERAMIVFKYFFDKMDLLGPLIDEKMVDEDILEQDAIVEAEYPVPVHAPLDFVGVGIYEARH